MNIPGFVDLQVNGYKGVDFSSPELSTQDFTSACQQLLDHGTAAFLPTIITSSLETYERNLPLMAQVMATDAFNNRLLGFHIEGPFISSQPGAVGAHNPTWVQQPSPKLLDQLQTWSDGRIKYLTIAAEAKGAAELTRHAVGMGITVSLGHQMATAKDLHSLANAGAKVLTHLGNGMPNLVDRHHNQIQIGMAQDALAAMIITDGHHLPDDLIKNIIRTKGVDRVIVTSDASPLAGMKPGHYEASGNRVVLEASGLLHNPEKQCMVGSSSTMLECMNYLASLNILSLEALCQLGFYGPLSLLGIDPQSINSLYALAYDHKTMTFSTH